MDTPLHAGALALAGVLAALPALASSTIQPPEPYAFDPINLRMTVDSCTFAPESAVVRAGASGNVIRVIHFPRQCVLPGEPLVVDIRLGSLPPGDWAVEVYEGADPLLPYTERIPFTVSDRPEILIAPRPPRPLTDYSGMWYGPAESGWGLSFHQSPTNVVFAGWYVYDVAGKPTWYTIQVGQWTSSTRWTGPVYLTSGPPFFAPVFDPAQVTVAPVGEAAIDFTQRPGEEGWATFTYSIGGAQGTKRITRLLF
jgi:hypothetical protein